MSYDIRFHRSAKAELEQCCEAYPLTPSPRIWAFLDEHSVDELPNWRPLSRRRSSDEAGAVDALLQTAQQWYR